jgi:hypothetical protein
LVLLDCASTAKSTHGTILISSQSALGKILSSNAGIPFWKIYAEIIACMSLSKMAFKEN